MPAKTHCRLRQVDHKLFEHQEVPGGAPTDLTPDLQHPENPLPLLEKKQPHLFGGGGG
jgi:hypothetical protein